MIDYNQDIAPLRQQYFPMLAGQRGFERAVKYHQEVFMPMQEQTMKMQSNALKLQQQQLAFESQQFNLTEARKKSQKEAEALERMPEAISQISSILDDPEQDAFSKQKNLAKLQMQFQPLAGYAPIVNNLFTAATNSVGSDLKRLQLIQDERDKTNQVMLTAARAGVDPALIGNVAIQDGDLSESDKLAIALAGTVQAQGLQELESKRFDLIQKQQSKLQEAQAKRADDITKTIIGMIPKEQQTDFWAALGKGGAMKLDSSQVSQEVKESLFSNKQLLQEFYRELLTPAELLELDRNPFLDDMPAEELFRAVYRRASMFKPSLRMGEALQNLSTASKFTQ